MNKNMQEANNTEINRRTARRMQETIENRDEVMAYISKLYKYGGPTIASGQCLLCGGDYMTYDNGMMTSARGAGIPMDPEALAEMVMSGAFSKVFDPSDINAADFGKRFSAIAGAMDMQRGFMDAARYHRHEHEDRGLAEYVSAQDPEKTEAVIIRDGDDIRAASLANIPEDKKDDIFANMRECDYDGFNPGRRDIQAMIRKTMNPETQNRSGAYAKMQEKYAASGGNEARSLEDIRNDKSMTPMEKMRAMGQSMDSAQQEEARKAAEFEEYAPQIPGAGRYAD